MHSIVQRTAMTAALALLTLAGAHAQMTQPAAPMAQPQAPMQQILAKRAEIQQLGQELQQIQQTTMDANPELAAQREELVTLMDTKMVDAGHDPEARRDEIANLQGQLQDEELSDSERAALRKELQKKISVLQQAQGQVMQDEDVLTQRQSLNDGLVKAMKKQDPQTEKLIRELQAARQEYQRLASQMRQQQGSARPPGS